MQLVGGLLLLLLLAASCQRGGQAHSWIGASIVTLETECLDALLILILLSSGDSYDTCVSLLLAGFGQTFTQNGYQFAARFRSPWGYNHV